ncbi:MAG: PEP-CTERM sorting domain-containing protein [Candidatus Omnitrophota bacterium]
MRRLSVFGIIALITLLLSARHALAVTLYNEVEPNSTFATAQALGVSDGSMDVSGSRVGDSSADYYQFYATAGDNIGMAVNTPGGPSYFDDPVLGLYNPSGVQLAFDDDDGPGYDSALGYSITSSGFYAAAVSGWADFDFDGGGESGWTYHLLINNLTPYNNQGGPVIPEPTSLGLLGMGLVGWFGFKKRS